MSDRASIRGARGGSSRGGPSGRGGRGGAHQDGKPQDRPRKENILDLGKYSDKRILVKFSGGREGM